MHVNFVILKQLRTPKRFKMQYKSLYFQGFRAENTHVIKLSN